MTIKDHKEDFPSRVNCRLINPAKGDIGIISEHSADPPSYQARPAGAVIEIAVNKIADPAQLVPSHHTIDATVDTLLNSCEPK